MSGLFGPKSENSIDPGYKMITIYDQVGYTLLFKRGLL